MHSGRLRAAAEEGADPPLAARRPLGPGPGPARPLGRDLYSLYKRIHNCEEETKTFLSRGDNIERGGPGESGAEPGSRPHRLHLLFAERLMLSNQQLMLRPRRQLEWGE